MTDFTTLSPEDLARVTTRDGRKVEIITTKGRSPRPVVGYVDEMVGVREWYADGAYISPRDSYIADLILPPAPRVYYLNRYEHQIVGDYQSAEEARLRRSQNWLALYRITDDGVSDTLPCEVIERNKEA